MEPSDSAFRSLVEGAPSVLGPRTLSNMSKSLVGDLKQRKWLKGSLN